MMIKWNQIIFPNNIKIYKYKNIFKFIMTSEYELMREKENFKKNIKK